MDSGSLLTLVSAQWYHPYSNELFVLSLRDTYVHTLFWAQKPGGWYEFRVFFKRARGSSNSLK